jgi:hypothetical protein
MFAPLSLPFLKSSAEFIQPNASSMLYGGEYYNVEWNMSNNVNLQFQIYNDTQDDWVSHINNNHFLSIVIDQTTNQYNWSVPLYLSQYWQNPSRMVLNSLDTSLSVVSDEFSIAGIYVNMSLAESNNILFMNNNVSITWETNANSNVFNVSVYDNTTNYNNIKYRQPLYPICSNVMTNETSLCEWNSINQSGTFVIGVTSDKLYGLSSQFHIYYNPTVAPTLTPTMPPSYAPTTQDPTNVPTQNPTNVPSLVPTTQRPTTINNNVNNENDDNFDNTLWIVLISLFGAIIIVSGCILYILKPQPANQTRPLSPHQQNTTTMYHNAMAQIPNHASNNEFYSTGYSNNTNHYEATPEPSPTLPTSVYVTQRPSLYPNINTDAGINTTDYSHTQFSANARATQNHSYETMSNGQHIYNRLHSSSNNQQNENIYDSYNLDNSFDC